MRVNEKQKKDTQTRYYRVAFGICHKQRQLDSKYRGVSHTARLTGVKVYGFGRIAPLDARKRDCGRAVPFPLPKQLCIDK